MIKPLARNTSEKVWKTYANQIAYQAVLKLPQIN